ncbi:hypothetical protein F444_18482 [Phytophthora nicotianae P1976]|uniref:Uncharacterized protein n=1 Tax=Phytophthora nicotianae P1976 TaxID=1317066 RepID=A0A080ZB74_PHYNI|nr:hypothetical protein F444_18482 [Phytophthora nicotianae P1976]
MSDFLQKDLEWWEDLVLQNNLSSIPMFDHNKSIKDRWLVELEPQHVIISNMNLGFEAKAQQLKQAAVADGTLGRYRKNFKFWESFCKEVGQPVWIDKLHRAEQARIVGLFAGLCASEGHNRSKVGNEFQTFDGKMAAVQFAHKTVRNAKPDYHDPEFELIAQGYKRSNSQVNLKQPVIAQMLLKMREVLGTPDKRGELMCGSIILPFFFLDRSSELWGPVTIDRSTGQERVHCIKVSNVKLLD